MAQKTAQSQALNTAESISMNSAGGESDREIEKRAMIEVMVEKHDIQELLREQNERERISEIARTQTEERFTAKDIINLIHQFKSRDINDMLVYNYTIILYI